MLARRIIPTLLCNGRNLVKGQRFQSWRVVGSAMQAARVHQGREVDELVILDVAATRERRSPDLRMVEELATECRMPLAVGGGIKTVEDVRQLLRHGADKVVIGAGGPAVMQAVADMFGSQAVVASVDVSGGPLPAIVYAQDCERSGAGEILLQSIDRDGTMTGYDLCLIREVSRAVSIPVIASGGCSGYEDMLAAFEAGADACAVGALFQFQDATPRAAAQFLKQHGLEVRL